MSIYRTETFYFDSSDYWTCVESAFNLIITTIFGGTQLSEHLKFELSSDKIYMYTSNSSATASYRISISLDVDGRYYTKVTWVSTGNLVKLDGMWLWKGQYAPSYNGDLMDINTGDYFTGSLKSVDDGIAICPLYTSYREIIEGAYMYGGGGLSTGEIYEIGGNLYMCISGNVLLSL